MTTQVEMRELAELRARVDELQGKLYAEVQVHRATMDGREEAIKKAVAVERERCAEIVLSCGYGGIADRIREGK